MPTVEEIQTEIVKSNEAVNSTLTEIKKQLTAHEAALDEMKKRGDRPEASKEHAETMKKLETTLDGAQSALKTAQEELVALKASTTHDIEELQKAMQRSGNGGTGGPEFQSLGERVIKHIEEQAETFKAWAEGTANIGAIKGMPVESFAKEPAFMGVAPGDVRKALSSTATTNFIAPIQLPGYLPLTRRSLRMRDLLPIVPMGAGSHGLYIRQKGFTSVATSAVTSITQTGGVATVTQTAHGYEDHDLIQIAGANQAGYNIAGRITVTGANTYTYAVASGTVSPATGTITAQRLNNYGAAGFVAEGDTKPEAQMIFEERTFAVQLIAHFMETTRQVLDDLPGLRSNIDSDLIYGLLLKEDKSLLYATGAGGQISGLLTDPDRQHYLWSQGETTDTKADAIRRARTLVELADFEATGAVVHPVVWEGIELQKGDDGHYIWVGVGGMNGLDPAGQGIWRMPMVTTRAIAADTALVGSFAQAATLYDRMAAKILFADQHGTNFTKNVLTILAEERLGLAVRRPEAFVEVTFDAQAA